MMDTALNRPKLREIDYLVELFGWPQHRIYDYIRQGKIPHVRVGRRIMIDPARIERWIETGGTSSASA